MLHFTQWMTAFRRKRAQHFFFHLKRLIQTEIHNLVDSKQADHRTDRRRDRQDSNRLAEKIPAQSTAKRIMKSNIQGPFFCPTEKERRQIQ